MEKVMTIKELSESKDARNEFLESVKDMQFDFQLALDRPNGTQQMSLVLALINNQLMQGKDSVIELNIQGNCGLVSTKLTNTVQFRSQVESFDVIVDDLMSVRFTLNEALVYPVDIDLDFDNKDLNELAKTGFFSELLMTSTEKLNETFVALAQRR